MLPGSLACVYQKKSCMEISVGITSFLHLMDQDQSQLFHLGCTKPLFNKQYAAQAKHLTITAKFYHLQ